LTYSFSYGQSPIKIKLIYKSKDISKPSNDTFDIKRVRAAIFKDSVVVRLKNKKKIVLPPDKIWGYQDDDSIFHRYYDGYFYRVLQLDTLVMYSRSSGKSGNAYFFSRGADGKILSLTGKNLKKEFSNNTCFLDKVDKGFKWYQDGSSYNNKTKSYKMIDFFKSCLSNIQLDKTKLTKHRH